jgi:hypothetical protein
LNFSDRKIGKDFISRKERKGRQGSSNPPLSPFAKGG